VVSEHVFPFPSTLGGDDSTYAQHITDARFTIPNASLLARVVDRIDGVPMEDRDTKGALCEYMLGKIASAGQNGGVDHGWFYDGDADGLSLDGKRTEFLPPEDLGPVPKVALTADDHAKNRPDIPARWRSGSGVPPGEKNHYGQDARATIHKRQGVYLPHWTRDGATYVVAFRLGDSLPRPVLESWLFERRDLVRKAEQMGRPLSDHEEKRLRELHSERVETYFDTGHGACWLRQPLIAQAVADALRHFDRQRYRLHAWCVMPNHVHVIVEPLPGHTLPSILHSWKSFTAKTANRLLGRAGGFWQDESYDHLIRDADDYAHAVRYVLENPAKAGLQDWPWVWFGEVAP